MYFFFCIKNNIGIAYIVEMMRNVKMNDRRERTVNTIYAYEWFKIHLGATAISNSLSVSLQQTARFLSVIFISVFRISHWRCTMRCTYRMTK